TLQLEIRHDQRVVALERKMRRIALLDRRQGRAFLVEQIERDRRRHADDELAAATLHAFFLDAAQHVQRRRFDRAYEARAAAMRTAFGRDFDQAGAQALARQFEQAERRDAADLDARAVALHRLLEPALDRM